MRWAGWRRRPVAERAVFELRSRLRGLAELQYGYNDYYNPDTITETICDALCVGVGYCR